ncbi:MAG: hypothetical protein ACO1NU_08635 [Arcticibacter sp.]
MNKVARDYTQFFAICKAHGFDYKEKVAEFTNDRTDSLRALTDAEFNRMLKLMTDLNKPVRQKFKPKPGDDQRKKMISIARQMRWLKDGKADVKRLDMWCKSQKYKKGLNQLSILELNVMVTIFETKVYGHYLSTLNK